MKSYSFSSKDPSCKEPYHDCYSREQTNQSTNQKLSVHCAVEPSIFIAESLMDLSSLDEPFIQIQASPGRKHCKPFPSNPNMELGSEL